MTFFQLGANLSFMNIRYLSKILEHHLKTMRQMVFLVGPRQVGKTTLAQSFLSPPVAGINFFNWDVPDHRKILLSHIFPGKEPLSQDILVFDEIHKYPRWKNTLKGLFDLHEPHTHWIITGSAMLNVYRKGQDSLLGRHFTYHLAPFSVAELSPKKGEKESSTLLQTDFELPQKEDQEALSLLLRFGGFPEPLFKAEETFLARWRTNRLDRLVNQDLAHTENLRHLPLVEQLMLLLPERVGSPLSLNSLRKDLEVHFTTAKHWMNLLERVFYGFFITPYSKKTNRMLKKEPKWYLWDWSEIENSGARFENLVAVHLLKYVNYTNDLGLDQLSLHYVRDKEKREVDFLICKKKKPALLIECKRGNPDLDPSLEYFSKILEVPHALQITEENIPKKIIRKPGALIQIIPAASFLKELV